jgi:hypothetical protein
MWPSPAWGAPAGARQLVARAEQQAAARGRNVFVIFGASWCVWCKVLAKYLEQPQVAPLLGGQFVLLDLTVEEQGAQARLDNPGAAQLMRALGGTDGSLPFLAILAPDGKLIVNSRNAAGTPPANIGYPVQPGEVAWFLHMLERGAPRLTAGQLRQLQRVLEAFATKYR